MDTGVKPTDDAATDPGNTAVGGYHAGSSDLASLDFVLPSDVALIDVSVNLNERMTIGEFAAVLEYSGGRSLCDLYADVEVYDATATNIVSPGIFGTPAQPERGNCVDPGERFVLREYIDLNTAAEPSLEVWIQMPYYVGDSTVEQPGAGYTIDPWDCRFDDRIDCDARIHNTDDRGYLDMDGLAVAWSPDGELLGSSLLTAGIEDVAPGQSSGLSMSIQNGTDADAVTVELFAEF